MSRTKQLLRGPFKKVVKRYFDRDHRMWTEELECGHEYVHYDERNPRKPPSSATKRKCYACVSIGKWPMKKLSEAQIRLLKILRDEDTTVDTINIRGDVRTYVSGIPENTPWLRYKTVSKLSRMGLIENITDPGLRWRGSTYKITEAGLKAIEGK